MCIIDFKNCKSCCGIAGSIVLIFLLTWLGVDIKNKINESPEAKNIITVSGIGSVFAKPDLAQTSFQVITEAKTVGEALSLNTEKMNSVIDFIKSQGTDAKDLKTVNFSISPRYEWQDKGTKRVLTGYEVFQSLQVKIRDLAKVGAIIEGAAQAGSNQIGDLQFAVDREDEFKKQAREEAIKGAKDKAKELAFQLGVRLVKITSFSESGTVPIFYGLERMASPSGGGAPRIEIGENKIEVQVSITYEIN